VGRISIEYVKQMGGAPQASVIAARRVLDGSAANRIVELTEGLDTLADVREMMDIAHT
jgi:hypothetical protein